MKIKSLLAGTMLSACVLLPSVSHASLNSELGRMFDNVMYNTTSPGSIDTARRSGYSFGSFSARTRIMNTNFVSMVPPSVSAGCGGLDMTGGSFSFINADEFVEFAKTVAQNAAGYMFYLALESYMPSVAKTMSGLQDMVNEFNRHFGNSCQLAQGIVENGPSAFAEQFNHQAHLETIREGATDLWGAFTSSTGQSSVERQSDNPELKGNLMWRFMRDQSTDGWFEYGDASLREEIISLTGTMIIGDNVPAPDGEGESPEITTLRGNRMSLRDFIDGGEVGIWQCTGGYSDCPGMVAGVRNIQGLRHHMEQVFFGVGGIFDRLDMNHELSNDQELFLGNLPGPMATMIFRLHRLSPTMAREVTAHHIGTLTVQMAYYMAADLITAGQLAVDGGQHTYAPEVSDLIAQSREALWNEYQALRSEYGSVDDLANSFRIHTQNAIATGVVVPDGLVPDVSGR